MEPEDPPKPDYPKLPTVDLPLPQADRAPLEPHPIEPGFTLNRDNANFDGLLSRASAAWRRDIGIWVLAMVVCALVLFALFMIQGVGQAMLGEPFDPSAQSPYPTSGAAQAFTFAMQVVQTVIQGILTMGLWAMAIQGLHGRAVSITGLLSQARKIGKYILQTLAIGLAFVLAAIPIVLLVSFLFFGDIDLDTPMSEVMELALPISIVVLVLMPVLIYVVLGLLFAPAELVFNDDAGPIEAIGCSWRIAKGKRWLMFGVTLLSSIIFMISAMLCGIGLLFGAPLSFLLIAALYLALRNGAEVPVADTTSTLG